MGPPLGSIVHMFAARRDQFEGWTHDAIADHAATLRATRERLEREQLAVVAAWSWVIWRSVKTGRRPAAATLRAMIAATALLVAAAGWPYLEPAVRRALKS